VIFKRLMLYRTPHDLSWGIAFHVLYGLPPRILQNIHRGVDVAVVHGATGRADPASDRQRQMSPASTHLAGRVPSFTLRQRASSLPGLGMQPGRLRFAPAPPDAAVLAAS